MKIKINVTQKDIDSGEPCDGRKCPVARAICRHVKPFLLIDVQEDLLIQTSKREYSFKVPPEVNNFVTIFDLRAFGDYEQSPIKPFSFILNIPKRFLKTR
jgi:hypothetical protein